MRLPGAVAHEARDLADGLNNVVGALSTAWDDLTGQNKAAADGALTSTVSNSAASTSLPSSVVMSSSQTLQSSLAVATITSSLATAPGTTAAPVVTVTTTSPASSATTSTSTSSNDSGSGDTSSAVKAGIAIGVLAGVLLVFLAIYFLYSKRKKQLERNRKEDEKIDGVVNAQERPLSTRTSATAPRLSLRPVTQFLPNLTTLPQRRQSLNADIVLTPTSAAAVNANKPLPSLSLWERPSTATSNHEANPFTNDAAPTNPFGHNAEHVDDRTPVSGPPSPTSPRPMSPARSVSPVSTIDSEVGVATTTDVPTAALSPSPRVSDVAAGLVRKTSIRNKDNGPQPLDLTKSLTPLAPVPPSPAGTEFSMHSMAPGQNPGPSASAAAIAAAGGPPQTTVHRVQLDFKPTLDDELGLKAGELVRLLHEYDDGWALCIRLDRSQQGVVPRTCLSTRPVKPRPSGPGPRGPPVNPSRGPDGRPMTPQGRPSGGPYSRSDSPSRPMTAGRSQSPVGYRPASPGLPMQGRPASPSGGPSQSRNGGSPPGSSALNQEYRPGHGPSPGQAY